MVVGIQNFSDNPWNETFRPFTELFEWIMGIGVIFYLVPISFIAVALFIKTKNLAIVSLYMITVGSIFSGAGILAASPEMSYIFLIFTILGLIGLFVNIFFIKK